MTAVRALVAVPLASLVAVLAIRAMIFIAPASHPLRVLEPMFGGHPTALTTSAMREIGASAAKGGQVPQSARQSLTLLASRSPLAPEPFLVDGTIAEMDSAGARAEPLFVAARTRDPRSEAARYFLATRYLKTGRIEAGLLETVALARLSERAAAPLVPALAAYAITPGAAPRLKHALDLSPRIRDGTLALLAQEPRNVDLVLALAPPTKRGAAPSDWQVQMINGFIKAGDLAAAERIWSRFSGVANRGLLYNPQFGDTVSFPPFNWELPASSAGVAEPADRGGLDVIYYGRADALLARQLLRLTPGSYRLAMRVQGTSGVSGLAWVVQCLSATQPIARVAVEPVAAGNVVATINVPANCPGQWIELRGQPTEAMATAELTISNLSLARAGAGS